MSGLRRLLKIMFVPGKVPTPTPAPAAAPTATTTTAAVAGKLVLWS